MACTSDARAAPTTRRIPAVGTSSPGTPLAAGLVVPDGARLIGSVFPRPEPYENGETVAVLEVTGDPFAAWDDLADQADGLGATLPHSGICRWNVVSNEPGAPSGPIVPVSERRPADANAVDCEASAGGPDGGGGPVSLLARLWRWNEGAELHLELADRGDATPRSSNDPNADPGPAPARASADLPALQRRAAPAVGDRFGFASNCPEQDIALRVPRGSRYVGGGTTPGLDDFGAVLAVADPHTTLTDLGHQLDPTGPTVGGETVDLERATVQHQAARVWVLRASRDAGGGACEIWSSLDGSAVLVTAHSD